MRRAFADGIAWGDAKQKLFERLDAELAPARERYDALIARPEDIEDRLLDGARKARERSRAFIEKLRWAVGVRRLTERSEANVKTAMESLALPQIKSYREADGKFYFKLADGDGSILLQSRAFDSPKDAGKLAAALVDASDDAPQFEALVVDAAPDRDAGVASRAAFARIKAAKG
jgi:tryptophanyl-tRNA synthetase